MLRLRRIFLIFDGLPPQPHAHQRAAMLKGVLIGFGIVPLVICSGSPGNGKPECATLVDLTFYTDCTMMILDD